MRYLTVDAMLSGTGLRDTYSGEYYSISRLGLSECFQEEFSYWLQNYHQEYFKGFIDKAKLQELDACGISLCRKLVAEKPDLKVEYYSEASSKRIHFS